MGRCAEGRQPQVATDGGRQAQVATDGRKQAQMSTGQYSSPTKPTPPPPPHTQEDAGGGCKAVSPTHAPVPAPHTRPPTHAPRPCPSRPRPPPHTFPQGVYGKDHLETADSCEYLGALLEYVQQHHEAELYHRRSVLWGGGGRGIWLRPNNYYKTIFQSFLPYLYCNILLP